jgi:hypothetical protein
LWEEVPGDLTSLYGPVRVSTDVLLFAEYAVLLEELIQTVEGHVSETAKLGLGKRRNWF